MTILDQRQYPWTQPAAQELHRTLISLYPSAGSAVEVAKRAGVDTSKILVEQAASTLWVAVLEYCAPRSKLRPLVQQALDESPSDFLRGLLAGETPAVSAEPLSAQGVPQFVRNNDVVTEPEALLFRDDLSMSVGRLPGLIATLGKLVQLAPSVCKLTVRVNAVEQYGTAFRVGEDLLLTNWHVVHGKQDEAPATMITAEFGFEDDDTGRPIGATPIPCDATIVASSNDEDWAVVRTTEALDSAWPTVDLANTATPDLNDAAFIIQHPLGQRKRVGFVRNQVSWVDDRIVQYLTDTDIGSSGSPVVDAEGKLIALHRAGGRPQEVLGKPPIHKNEGIRISRVVEGMRKAGL